MPPISLFLDTRRAVKNNKFPIRIRITFEVYEGGKTKWVARYVPTKQYVTEKEFDMIIGQNAPKSEELRKVQREVLKIRARVSEIIEANPRIKIEAFYREYEGETQTTKPVTLADFFDIAIKGKREDECIGTALSYENAKASILKFGGNDITVADITQAWLKRYEMHMLSAGHSVNTVGIYLRSLRVALNIAKEKGFLSLDDYPFGNKRYVIRAKRTKKKALPPDIKDKILNFKPTTEAQQKAWDYTMFSFFANGMNFTDMAYLTREQIKENEFTFIRRKIRNTVQEQKEIVVVLSPMLKDILRRRTKVGSYYIFGVITPDMDAEQQKSKIRDWISNTNRRMNGIVKAIGYEGKITTYYWRHTFTTMLLNSGIPITKVKDSLGHTRITTTEVYAEDLDIDTSKTFHNILLGTGTGK